MINSRVPPKSNPAPGCSRPYSRVINNSFIRPAIYWEGLTTFQLDFFQPSKVAGTVALRWCQAGRRYGKATTTTAVAVETEETGYIWGDGGEQP